MTDLIMTYMSTMRHLELAGGGQTLRIFFYFEAIPMNCLISMANRNFISDQSFECSSRRLIFNVILD